MDGPRMDRPTDRRTDASKNEKNQHLKKSIFKKTDFLDNIKLFFVLNIYDLLYLNDVIFSLYKFLAVLHGVF